MINGGGEGGFESFGLFQGGGGGGNQEGRHGAGNLFAGGFQLGRGFSGNGVVEGELEETFDAFDQLVLEGEGVFQLGLGAGIDYPAALQVSRKFGLHFGNLSS